jgi:hypothetical protein
VIKRIVKPTWNAKTNQMEDKGKALAPWVFGPFQRVWWDLGLKGAAKARLTFERLDDELVAVELRIEGGVTASTLKVLDQKTSSVLATLEIRGGNSVVTHRVKLPKGQAVRAELASGARSPDLTP